MQIIPKIKSKSIPNDQNKDWKKDYNQNNPASRQMFCTQSINTDKHFPIFHHYTVNERQFQKHKQNKKKRT